MSIDPYASPALNKQPPTYSSDVAVPRGVMEQLAGTKPWVRFLSVIIFIGAGLMLLIALIMAVAGSAFASVSSNSMLSGGMGLVVIGFYGVMAFLYIYPALKLWKYASCIGVLMNSYSMTDLEFALSQQRSFWKFIGIMTLAIIGLYIMVVIGIVVLGGFAAAASRR